MKKSKSNIKLSIIIPCADDERIKYCLDSIDENVEVIVVLNGSSRKVKYTVGRYEVKKIIISEKNLPKALNIGINKARNNIVLFMDADCVFQKGAIRKLYEGLGNNYLAKGNVIFGRNNFPSTVIAKVREYLTSDTPKPYNPFLCMRKNIKSHIDNYYFDNDIHWTEDADLALRVSKAGIKVNYVSSAKIFHPPLTFRYDLRSAFRYGIGKRIRVEKGIANGIGSFFNCVIDIVKKKGIWAGLYLFTWSVVYTFGYIYQIIGDPYKIKPVIYNKN